MIPTLEELKKDIHITMKHLRNIDILINTEQFQESWESLPDDKKLLVVNKINWKDKNGIVDILKNAKKQELGEMNVTQLRKLAKKRGLPGFMQMGKSTLLSELSKLEGLPYDEE